MDEATANVDAAADEAIQRAIRTAFAGSTVITVAHRISTVVDCDRILVLDGGCVAEFDSPKVLLSNPQSLFRKLCEETASTLNEDNSLLKSSSKDNLPIRFSYK
jgi:ATP-binding cassette, subfamily C (CFTR/MRP), member 1